MNILRRLVEKLPAGLRPSADGVIHVDPRRYRTYPTKDGGAKLVPLDERGKVKRPPRH